MKVLFISMPDAVAIVMHEAAFHFSNHGIASVAGNIDPEHQVYLVDLIRKRRSIKKYLSRTMKKIQPDLVGLSAMAWQYDTCVKIAHLLKELSPQVKIVIGGYHATLMYEEIATSQEARWVDFIVRGEGEEVCRRLVNCLAGGDSLDDIPSLSYKKDGEFIHNPLGENLDLAALKLPVRDRRRLTWGYHIINHKIELLETSRGCTRSCNFCSMKRMYGRTFRTFPIQRVLEDLDDIYYKKKTRWVFITDDNMVLNPGRVMELCDAIIARGYRNLNFIVQADCITMARNEPMVARMAEAGFRSVFLGIENVSKENLCAAGKKDIVAASRQAIAICHKHDMMVVGGLIFGFPEDDEKAIRENYEFIKEIEADTVYCQVLTPYPETGMRQMLLDKGLVTNKHDYKRYNGLWANVRTRYLDTDELQYQVWYQRQVVLSWWNPPSRMRNEGWGWTLLWRFLFKPFLKLHYRRVLRKYDWRGRYEREVERWHNVNRFRDLEGY